MNAEADAEPDAHDEPKARGRKVAGGARRVVVVVLLVLGLLAATVGNLAAWGWYFLFDSNNFVTAVAPLSSDDDVSRVIAGALVDQAFESLEVEGLVSEALPDEASFLSGPITTGAQSFSTDAVQALIQSDAFQAVWSQAVEVAHEVMLATLRGDGELIDAQNGQVVLDLSSAGEALSEALSSVGLDIIDPDSLPDDFGRIVLLEDEQLGVVQDAVALLDALSIWLPIAALILWAIAIVLARDRRRVVGAIGISLAVLGLVQLVFVRIARNSLLDNVEKDDARAAVTTVWREVTEDLTRGLWALVALGVVVSSTTYLLGPADRAVRVREGLKRRIAELRGEADPEAEPDLAARLVRPYRRVIEVAVVAIALVALISVPAPGIGTVVITAFVVAAAFGLIELAAGPRTRPDRGPQVTESEGELDEVADP